MIHDPIYYKRLLESIEIDDEDQDDDPLVRRCIVHPLPYWMAGVETHGALTSTFGSSLNVWRSTVSGRWKMGDLPDAVEIDLSWHISGEPGSSKVSVATIRVTFDGYVNSSMDTKNARTKNRLSWICDIAEEVFGIRTGKPGEHYRTERTVSIHINPVIIQMSMLSMFGPWLQLMARGSLESSAELMRRAAVPK